MFYSIALLKNSRASLFSLKKSLDTLHRWHLFFCGGRGDPSIDLKRPSNILEAYENAAQAAVLVRTAKEVDIDVSRLTKGLGVDFHEYLSYTSAVPTASRSPVCRPGQYHAQFST
jgi:hypothetical protein